MAKGRRMNESYIQAKPFKIMHTWFALHEIANPEIDVSDEDYKKGDK